MEAQLLQTQEEEAAKKARESTYSGNDAVVTGFWAKDRPNEERIDPDNMKIYTFKTYKHRFPYKHSWDVEVMWKKLPLAPKKVHKVPKTREHDGVTGALIEEGMTLVDEKHRELVWTKDYNGYFHLGTAILSEDEIYVAAHPRDWQLENKRKKEQEQQEKYALFTDHSEFLEEQRKKLHSDKATDREAATHSLEHMTMEMEDTLGMQSAASKTGKGYVSVQGAEGHVASFNVDVAKVTGMAVKRKIEN